MILEGLFRRFWKREEREEHPGGHEEDSLQGSCRREPEPSKPSSSHDHEGYRAGVKKRRMDSPGVKEIVINRLAAGESQSGIAREMGLGRTGVCRFANREDVQKMVEEQTMSFLEAVPDAVQNVKDLVREMPEIPKGDTKRRELSLKASLKVLEAPGIVNTTTPSQTFLNITKTDNLILLPEVAAILREHSRKFMALAGHKEGDGGEKREEIPETATDAGRGENNGDGSLTHTD